MAREPTYRPLIDASPARRVGFLAAACLAILAIITGLLIGSYTAYRAEGRRSRENVAVYNGEVNADGELIRKLGNDPLDLTIDVAALDLDPIRGVLKISSKIERKKRPGKAVVNGTVLLGSFKAVPFSSKAATIDQDTSVLMDGDVAMYPFDSYSTQLPFAASTGDAIDNPEAAPLKWAAYAAAQTQAFRFRFAFVPDPDSSIVMLEVTAQRPPTTKIFSVFLACIQWLLALSALTIAGQVFLRDREVPPNKISVMAALLFAMPSIRNTSPSAPPIGTLLDTLSLFWCMTIIGCCAIYLQMTYVMQGKDPQRPASSGYSIGSSASTYKG